MGLTLGAKGETMPTKGSNLKRGKQCKRKAGKSEQLTQAKMTRVEENVKKKGERGNETRSKGKEKRKKKRKSDRGVNNHETLFSSREQSKNPKSIEFNSSPVKVDPTQSNHLFSFKRIPLRSC